MATMVEMIGALALLGAPLTQPGQLPWLTLVTFSPLIGVLALLLMPGKQESALRTIALASTLLTFAISIGIMVFFDAGVATAPGPFTFQMTEGPVPWIPTMGIHYAMGIDGLSLWLVMLATFLYPMVILSTYSAVNNHVKEYMICLLEIGRASCRERV